MTPIQSTKLTNAYPHCTNLIQSDGKMQVAKCFHPVWALFRLLVAALWHCPTTHKQHQTGWCPTDKEPE